MKTPNPTDIDIIVLGGGPAGYSAAICAAQNGARVTLIEKSSPGGTCLNRGCVPTKFLWEALHTEKKIKRSSDYGLDARCAKPLFSAVQEKKKRAVELLVKGLRATINSYGITIIEGEGVFAGPREIAVSASDGTTRTLKASRIIIATGSRPKGLPGFEINHTAIIDSNDLLELKELPASMLIIGGGAIGVEFATILSGFGCEVTLAEKESHILPLEDVDLAGEIKKLLERRGVKVVEGSGSLDELAKNAEKILVAAGRQPNVEALQLDKAGVAFTPKGIVVNEILETSQKGIFACGDVTGKGYLAYIAQNEGAIAAENALGAAKTPECAAIPRVVFSDPPAASVGIRESEAGPGAVTVGRYPLTANARAFMAGERIGGVKLLADKKTGAVLGGHIIGTEAESLITIIALAIRNQLTIEDLGRELFFHPSIAETIHCAAEDTQNKCIELPSKKRD